MQRAHLVDREDVGDENANKHRGDQIHQHGEGNHQVHDQRPIEGDAVGALDEIPVDDVDTHLQGNASQHRLRNLGGEWSSHQDHQHQDHRAEDAGEGAAAAALDVHHRAHGGASAGQATEQATHQVAQALANQFFVGVVLSAGEAVGHHRGEQGINAAEHAKHSGIHHHQLQFSGAEHRQLQLREAGGNFANAANVLRAKATDQWQRHQGSHQQRNQLRRGNFFELFGREPEDGQGDQRQANLQGPGSRDQLRQRLQGANHTPLGAGLPQEGAQLQDDQDQADPAHEAGDHRVRHLGDVPPQTQQAKADLKHPSQHHHREGHGQAVLGVAGCQASDDCRHHHRHRARGLGDQRGRAAKEGREETHQHRTPEACCGASAAGYTESQGHR